MSHLAADLPVQNSRPIGVFDSGIGGLTVASALKELLPSESIYYVGDTARVPYGGKSAATIERYSLEISRILLNEGAKLIVVACNSASAWALEALQRELEVPVVGVIQPGASAAVAATRNQRVGVIGTRATINSLAYEKAIHALNPLIEVEAHACPLLVPLIEEGWLDDPITMDVVARYLDPMLNKGIDTLVLGCTHYPLLRNLLEKHTEGRIQLVDSARNCALEVQSVLAARGLVNQITSPGRLQVDLTDSSSSFLKVAEHSLGLDVGEVRVRAVG